MNMNIVEAGGIPNTQSRYNASNINILITSFLFCY